MKNIQETTNPSTILLHSQIQQPSNSQKRHLPWVRIIIFSLMLASLVAGIIIEFIDQHISSIPHFEKIPQLANLAWAHPVAQGLLVIVTPSLALLVSFIQWLFPLSSDDPTPQPYVFLLPHPQTQVVPQPSFPAPNAAFHDMVIKPIHDNLDKVQQRDELVKDIYEKLISAGVSAIVLTGIGGVGKSVLAELIYDYAEKQRNSSDQSNIFTAEPIWIKVDETSTMLDLTGSIFETLGKSLPEDFSSYSSRQQAVALFEALNSADNNARLLIFDQFNFFLNDQTGFVLTGQPGVSEWLNEINCRPCKSRMLLTSRIWLEGVRVCSPSYIQEYPVKGLTIDEGIKLLQDQNITATEEELGAVISHCDGHPLALIELAYLLRRRKLSLKILLHDSWYSQFWVGDTLRKCLSYIVAQLSKVQYKLLLAFSIFRQPVSLDALQAIKIFITDLTPFQIRSALDILLIQNLLQASNEGLYQIQAIVAIFIQSNFVQDDTLSNQHILILQSAHSKAAQYYIQRFNKTRRPSNQPSQLSDVKPLIEAIWQYTQADLFQEAYDLAMQEDIFTNLRNWRENAILLELYQLLLSSDKWMYQKQTFAIGLYKDLEKVYKDMGQQEKATRCSEKVNSLQSKEVKI